MDSLWVQPEKGPENDSKNQRLKVREFRETCRPGFPNHAGNQINKGQLLGCLLLTRYEIRSFPTQRCELEVKELQHIRANVLFIGPAVSDFAINRASKAYDRSRPSPEFVCVGRIKSSANLHEGTFCPSPPFSLPTGIR